MRRACSSFYGSLLPSFFTDARTLLAHSYTGSSLLPIAAATVTCRALGQWERSSGISESSGGGVLKPAVHPPSAAAADPAPLKRRPLGGGRLVLIEVWTFVIIGTTATILTMRMEFRDVLCAS